jgi:hypothetical protein
MYGQTVVISQAVTITGSPPPGRRVITTVPPWWVRYNGRDQPKRRAAMAGRAARGLCPPIPDAQWQPGPPPNRLPGRPRPADHPHLLVTRPPLITRAPLITCTALVACALLVICTALVACALLVICAPLITLAAQALMNPETPPAPRDTVEARP